MTPGLITYRKSLSDSSVLAKDTMSAYRANKLEKQVCKPGGSFPKDIHLVQEMLLSADITEPPAVFKTDKDKVKNVSDHHEVFECHWTRSNQGLKIFRIQNCIKKSTVQIAFDEI